MPTIEFGGDAVPKPRLIQWVGEERVFKTAALSVLAAPEDYSGYDLSKHLVLYDHLIPSHELDLFQALYLGPEPVKEQPNTSSTKLAKNRLRGFQHDLLHRIVARASSVAFSQRVPYFAVGIVQAEPAVVSTYLAEHYIVGGGEAVRIPPGSKWPQRPIPSDEFVLHPTVQLYVLRK